ncbi:transaldolase [Patescibacteria group bacterium]|nr:transaldolase [Patescibacteria group bacterium]
MKPEGLNTRIFLDSGDPSETKEVYETLGFLDGQTTNPSLIAKNPDVKKHIDAGGKFTREEVYAFYKEVLHEIDSIIPHGSLSVEVYADESSTAEEIIAQAEAMNTWVPHAHVKIPITQAGLSAGEKLSKKGMHLNFTLCFTEEQAAAVHAATRGAKEEQIYISPFIGRLDDTGLSGVSLVEAMQKLYLEGKSPVQVLAASVRNLDHFLQVISQNVDIVTAPKTVLIEWAKKGFPLLSPEKESDLANMAFKQYDLSKEWQTFDIDHELTQKGLKKFADDWNALIQK